jgi:hypothetical protein
MSNPFIKGVIPKILGLRECRLDVDAADLDAALLSSTSVVATWT